MNLTAIGEKLTDTKLLELAPEFNAKMVRIMDAIGYLQKDAEAVGSGNFGGYKYASARKVLDRVRDECVKEGISVESESDIKEFHIVGTKSLAGVKTTLHFTDGIFVAKAEGLGSGIDSGDKAVMKANTAAIKYACSGKFIISWGDDPEADDETDGPESEAVSIWLELCEKASGSPLEKFKGWWPTNKAKILAECSEEGAAEVYKAFTDYLTRLRKEVEDAGD